MPTFYPEDDWTVVRHRRDRRGGRDFGGDRRSPRRTSYPSRTERRTYASVARGRNRREEREIPHDVHPTWHQHRRAEQPAAVHYETRHRDRSERGHRFEQERARDRSYPAHAQRRTYASVVSGWHHRREEREIPHTWRRRRSRERPTATRYRPNADAACHGVQTEQGRWTDRGQARDRRYMTRTRFERSEPPRHAVPSDDSDFSAKVRIIHRLIKSVHHLKNVSRDKYPPSLNKIAQNLMTVIKPAAPSKQTQTRIEGNAKNWADTAVLILRDHYSMAMEEELKRLFEFPKQEWEGPFEVASSWAKRNLGRRLRPESLDQTQAAIIARLADLRADTELGGQSRVISEPTRQPEVREDLITLDSTEPLMEVLQPAPAPRPAAPRPRASRAVTVTAQVHAPPPARPVTTATASTMTDFVRGDWSPFIEREGEEDDILRPITPTPHEDPPEPTPMSPKDRRVRRVFAALHTTSSEEEPPPPTQSPQPGDDIMIEVMDLTQGDATIPTRSIKGSKTVPGPSTTAHLGLPRTTQERLKSCVQTRLQTRRLEESSQSPPLTSASTAEHPNLPTRHPNTQKKLQDWSLDIKKSALIIGDSNVSTFPSFSAENVQIDSFPGAKWCHAQALLEKATASVEVEIIVLSFGLNNRSQRDRNTPITDLKKTLLTAHTEFPGAEIYVPVVNFSSALPQSEQDTLLHLNTFITSLVHHIPALPADKFETGKDNIHWTDATAEHMLGHWSTYVNGESP